MKPYYQDASVTLYRGEALTVLPMLADDSVDGVFTDPPYSSGGMTRGDRMGSPNEKYMNSESRGIRPDFAGDNRDQRSYAYWCQLWLSECLRITKPGGICAIFTDWRQLPTTTDAFQAGGWVWRGINAWDKTEGVRPQKGRYAAQCEYVVWGSKGPMGEPRSDAPCLPGYFRVGVRQADKFHVTGKPTDLMEQLLRIVPAGGVVLDPFVGSGTTLRAAKALGLRGIGIEVEAEYCRVAAERAGQQSMLSLLPSAEQSALPLEVA